MAERKKKPAEKAEQPQPATADRIRLSQLVSKRRIYQNLRFWIVGITPLITHAWAEKTRIEMLGKQLKIVKAGREARDPDADYLSSLYPMGEDVYGFPVTGIKKAILRAAHKDKGVARQAVLESLYLDAEMTRVMPARAGAICDLPLVRVWSAAPEMREDMVRVGMGLTKTASLAYRAQFTRWAIKVEGRINPKVLTMEALSFLIEESGMACGIGEWRNEKGGVFGAYRLADEQEEKEWEAFAAGKGPLPQPVEYLAEAAE